MVLEDDEPPQTIRDAMSLGWTALTVECPSCRWAGCPKEGRLLFRDVLEQRGNCPIATVFAKAKCSRCGRRPNNGKLAASVEFGNLTSWHERQVLFIDGYVVKPGRW